MNSASAKSVNVDLETAVFFINAKAPAINVENTGTNAAATGAEAAATGAPICGWELDEVEAFEAHATKTYDEASTEEFKAAATARLLEMIPDPVNHYYNLPGAMEAKESVAICQGIKENIFEAIKQVRCAWVHDTAERERLAATGASGEATGSAASTPLRAPEVVADACLSSIGDVVMGHATKNKQAYDNKKCVVVAVLAKHYKVEMQEGSERQQFHKYFHKDVMRVVPPPTDAPDPNRRFASV